MHQNGAMYMPAIHLIHLLARRSEICQPIDAHASNRNWGSSNCLEKRFTIRACKYVRPNFWIETLL